MQVKCGAPNNKASPISPFLWVKISPKISTETGALCAPGSTCQEAFGSVARQSFGHVFGGCRDGDSVAPFGLLEG